tara:strand:- start:240 stop:572 length:333 start_codon:yes stop_codon:yes gene_type:complete
VEERRQILLKIAKQLRTTSDFVEGIERSLRIMVGLNVLEPQIKAVLESLTQSQQVMSRLHEESLMPTAQEESQNETIKTENYNLKERIYKLIEENKQLKSQIEDAKTSDD